VTYQSTGRFIFNSVGLLNSRMSVTADSLFRVNDTMMNCIVCRKQGLSIAYELYLESSGQFLVSCVRCPSMSPLFLFVKLLDCHLRRFEELCCNINIRQYVAKMVPDWISGQQFSLTTFDGNDLCQIKLVKLLTTLLLLFKFFYLLTTIDAI
jgi:hypothetical protein